MIESTAHQQKLHKRDTIILRHLVDGHERIFKANGLIITVRFLFEVYCLRNINVRLPKNIAVRLLVFLQFRQDQPMQLRPLEIESENFN